MLTLIATSVNGEGDVLLFLDNVECIRRHDQHSIAVEFPEAIKYVRGEVDLLVNLLASIGDHKVIDMRVKLV